MVTVAEIDAPCDAVCSSATGVTASAGVVVGLVAAVKMLF
jgi:hypothetical protein